MRLSHSNRSSALMTEEVRPTWREITNATALTMKAWLVTLRASAGIFRREIKTGVHATIKIAPTIPNTKYDKHEVQNARVNSGQSSRELLSARNLTVAWPRPNST